MAGDLTAVDAARLARPFLYFLVLIVALGVVFGVVALAGLTTTMTLAGAFAVCAVLLVGGLAVTLMLAARRHGHTLDPDDAVLAVAVQDVADWAIAVAALVSAGLVLWQRARAGPADLLLVLAVALAAVGAVAVLRLWRVRLLVYPDALIRAPASGLANRYPLGDVELEPVGSRFLRVTADVPLADWTCVTDRGDEIVAAVERLREEE